MAQIGWDESTPADTESLAQGDDRIRSLKTSIRWGLEAEHSWPSAGGDAGIHLLGSARAYVGSQSLVSSSGTDGRLMWASNTGQFFHVGSLGTCLIGSPQLIRMFGNNEIDTIPSRYQWSVEVGKSKIDSSSTGSITITFSNSGYSGLPKLFITEAEPNGTVGIPTAAPVTVWAVNKTPTQFTAVAMDRTGSLVGGGGVNFDWMSIGTVAL